MKRIITNDKERDEAIARIDELWGTPAGSPKRKEFEFLVQLVSKYENEYHANPPVHPIDMILFRLDQLNLPESELNHIFGSRSRKSEILSGKRKLTLGMIRMLHDKLGIPYDSLMAPYEVKKAAKRTKRIKSEKKTKSESSYKRAS